MPAVVWPTLERLGSLRLASAATTTGVLTIPAREQLLIQVNIAGYGGGDIAALRFNGDTATNYWDRHLTAAAGGTTWVNTQTVATTNTMIRLAGTTTTQGRSVTCTVMNIATISKSVGLSHIQTNTGSAGTAGTLDFGGGEWINTSAQITSIEMITAGGATLTAGSGFIVYGSNP